MTILNLLLGGILLVLLGAVAWELHRQEQLVQRLEQYAAHERRPKHGRVIHSNYEEPIMPAFETLPRKIFEQITGRRDNH
ncbi:hypothetical protein CK501_08605 [Halovibrio salipaludis]|uniref:Uncharacterized protein n=1 Tax=Halovibrio salipaludis TaxID=2032626 RepID=A0A2A2F7I2_9GAMM|nr:hypothetical protein [Halovibrio salipaludis]PAU80493.1 hypothetical protein CK501_08605 [Halovibrio salipaludis]